MNTRSLTFLTVALLAISIVPAASMQSVAFAQNDGQGMTMMVMAGEGSDTVIVSGNIVKTLPTDITFTVTSPDGLNVVDVAQVTPENGEFETAFVINPAWHADGLYTITATGGLTADTSLYRISLPIMVVDGVAQQDTMESDGNLEALVPYEPDTTAHIPTGITIEASAEIGSDTIMITGMTDVLGEDVTLTVTSPNGNIVTVEQTTPDLEGNYDATIITGGMLWAEDGMYTVMAQQNDDPLYTASAVVDIEDGVVVPEFGTIAAMILAVAIVSIIVVSTRSRLSIVAGH